MTAEKDLERALAGWLEHEAAPPPPREPLEHVLSATRALRPRSALVAGVGSAWVGSGARFGSGSLMALRLATAAVVVLMVGVGLYSAIRPRDDQGTTLSSPSPQPTQGASAQPSAAASPAQPSRTPVLPTSGPARPAGATELLAGVAMEAGQTYTTLSFTPAFTFSGGAGWQMLPPRIGGLPPEGRSHAYFLGSGLLGSDPFLVPAITITKPTRVITEGGAAVEAAPADLAVWLQARTDLVLGKPKSITVGGFTGTQLEGTVRKGAKANAVGAINMICTSDNKDCGPAYGDEVGVGPGERFRFLVIDVRGQTVLVMASSSAATWTTDLPALETFTNSITFP